MIINVEKNNDCATLKLEGRLDTITASQLESEISSLLKETKHFVLDMAKLEYLSSAGLRVLLSAQKQVRAEGSLKLVHVCESVMEVFEITGFADILVIE